MEKKKLRIPVTVLAALTAALLIAGLIGACDLIATPEPAETAALEEVGAKEAVGTVLPDGKVVLKINTSNVSDEARALDTDKAKNLVNYYEVVFKAGGASGTYTSLAWSKGQTAKLAVTPADYNGADTTGNGRAVLLAGTNNAGTAGNFTLLAVGFLTDVEDITSGPGGGDADDPVTLITNTTKSVTFTLYGLKGQVSKDASKTSFRITSVPNPSPDVPNPAWHPKLANNTDNDAYPPFNGSGILNSHLVATQVGSTQEYTVVDDLSTGFTYPSLKSTDSGTTYTVWDPRYPVKISPDVTPPIGSIPVATIFFGGTSYQVPYFAVPKDEAGVIARYTIEPLATKFIDGSAASIELGTLLATSGTAVPLTSSGTFTTATGDIVAGVSLLPSSEITGFAPATGVLSMRLDTDTGDGFSQLLFDQPVYGLAATGRIGAVVWHLRGGAANNILDSIHGSGTETDTIGGGILLGVGDLSGIDMGGGNNENGIIINGSL